VNASDRFRRLVDQPEEVVALDEAALLIAAHAYPSLDVAAELERLDAIADSCFAPTLDALIRHLFVDLGFRGNHRDYYNPRNSYLNDVVERRKGIPITLSVLTMSVGRRLGVPLAGVGMPGHFLLRDRVDPDVFVDPFAGGMVLDRRGCMQAFHRVQGDEAPFDPSFLEPVGSYTVIARMLQNLRAVFSALGDHRSVVWVLELRTSLPGVPIDERAEWASALVATGDFLRAADVFDRLGTSVGGELGEQYLTRAGRLRAKLN
jgi:regulator of sirC expression with transglutaminase-like and TPR domain